MAFFKFNLMTLGQKSYKSFINDNNSDNYIPTLHQILKNTLYILAHPKKYLICATL